VFFGRTINLSPPEISLLTRLNDIALNNKRLNLEDKEILEIN
jgi:hypothetical protein